jgi:hypothetical protein
MTCGECKHGKPKASSRPDLGKELECSAPVPMCVDQDGWWVIWTHSDATDCPCFERKEEK